jgi:RND family efflux transporter MFP subunit
MTLSKPIVVLAALSALAGLAACSNGSKAEPAPETSAMTVSPDNIAVLDSVTLLSGPAISGDLEPERSATIRAEIGASVRGVSVDEGQRVTRGQLLATLDESAIMERHRSAKSRVAAAGNAATVARREAERARRLLQGGAVAERDVEIAERAQWTAEAELEDARATLASAERELERTRLRAPFNGIVSMKNVSVGDVVQVGNELFQVVDPGSLRLEAGVPVSAIGSLAIGSVVQFHVTGYEGQTFNGRIERINPAVDPGTRQVRIVVAIPNTGSLVAGLFAEGRVATDQKRTVAVPVAAVDQRGAAPTVRRIHEGRVQVVAVQLGLRDDVAGLVEVTSGLARGDTVLTGGAMSTAAGTPVLVRKE